MELKIFLFGVIFGMGLGAICSYVGTVIGRGIANWQSSREGGST